MLDTLSVSKQLGAASAPAASSAWPQSAAPHRAWSSLAADSRGLSCFRRKGQRRAPY